MYFQKKKKEALFYTKIEEKAGTFQLNINRAHCF